ncbi:MAG: ABC transporter permease [Thermosynechococcaceae cyanobacterium]
MQRNDFLCQLWRSPTGRFGLGLVLGLALLAITAPLGHPIGSTASQDYATRLQAPSWTHPLGTDGLGRELWQLAWSGLSVSLGASVAAVSLGCSIGLVLGTLAGYGRGLWEVVIGWLTDILLAFPPILLAIAIATLLGPSFVSILVAISLIQIPIYTRLTRSLVLSLSAQPFTLAAEAVGASPLRIMTRHLLPATLGPLVVQATLSTGTATLEVAGLGFLGLGAQPPTAELGTLMADAFRNGYALSAPWTMLVPGAIITLMVFAFNLLGDGLRDSLDPQGRLSMSP